MACCLIRGALVDLKSHCLRLKLSSLALYSCFSKGLCIQHDLLHARYRIHSPCKPTLGADGIDSQVPARCDTLATYPAILHAPLSEELGLDRKETIDWLKTKYKHGILNIDYMENIHAAWEMRWRSPARFTNCVRWGYITQQRQKTHLQLMHHPFCMYKVKIGGRNGIEGISGHDCWWDLWFDEFGL
jgi:hypothetical protein